MIYTTKSGDMWDQISHDVYGTSAYISKLIYANPDYADTLIFPAGVQLEIPSLKASDVDASFVPPWRR